MSGKPGSPDSTAIQFKKRKKRKRNLLTTKDIIPPQPTVDESVKTESKEDPQSPADTTTTDDDAAFLKELEEAKFLHRFKFQSRNKGLVFEENQQFTTSGLENPDTFRHDPSKDFGDSFSTEKTQDDKLKQQREKWVEEQMRGKLLEKGRILPQNDESKTQGVDGDKEQTENQGTSFQEQLYALSDKLTAPSSSMRHSEEAGERWLAGMTEYELPLEFKLKNIKQTEDAKKKLLQPKSKHDKVFDIPRNYNGDFTTHHFDRVKMAEQKRKLMESKQTLRMERERKRRRTGLWFVIQKVETKWYLALNGSHCIRFII